MGLGDDGMGGDEDEDDDGGDDDMMVDDYWVNKIKLKDATTIITKTL
jgi:hypothetical protein